MSRKMPALGGAAKGTFVALRENQFGDPLSASQREPHPAGAERTAPDPDGVDPVAIAHQIYAFRRRRERLFGDAKLFGEPAWDILLDLYIASGQGKRISVSSLCIASSVPQATAVRWIHALEASGHLQREPDPFDRRRAYVRLSEATSQSIEALLKTVGSTAN